MSLEYTVNFSPNDMAGQHEAELKGGPFHGSVIQLNDKRCSSITVTEDGTQATYMNTNTTNSDNQHIFLHEL